MGTSSSKPMQYPLPMPGQNGYGVPQPMWSGKKGRGRSNSDGYFMTIPVAPPPPPHGYTYAAQPYPYYPAQNFSSSYYPQVGGRPPAAPVTMPPPQANMQMPAPNPPPAQQGTTYDPAAVPPPPVTMPAQPQANPVVPVIPSQVPQQPPLRSPQQERERRGQEQQQQQQQPQQERERRGQEQRQQQQPQQQPPQPPQQQPQPQQQQPQQAPVIPPAANDYRDPDGHPVNPSVYGPPGPRPRTPIKNPLPTPPRDLYEMSPYRSLIRDLPVTTSLLSRQYNIAPAQAELRRNGGGGGLGSLLGSKSGKDKKSRKGLFRSSSQSAGRHDTPPLATVFNGPMQRSVTFGGGVPTFPSAYSQNGAATGASNMPASNSAPANLSAATATTTTSTIRTGPADNASVQPVRFDHNTPLAGFMNHSPHRVIHRNETYPSALHLLEALKFVGHPELAERIKAVNDIHDVYPISASMQEFVRADWGQVFLQTVEEVLYLKFKQHPDLRSLLMNTGTANIIYSEANDAYWGEGATGQGSNELGKAIVRVRERLRREGYTMGPPVNSAAAPPP